MPDAGADRANVVHGLPHGEPGAIIAARIESQAEREEAFRLRYRCYRREGIIAERADERLEDRHDADPSSYLFGFRWQGELVASIRLHVLDGRHRSSPTATAFHDILDPMLDSGLRLLDPTRFVIDHDTSRIVPGLAQRVLRVPFLASHHFGVDVALAAVRTEHMAFYRRFLRYAPVATPRPYLMLTKPLALMIADYPLERPAVLKRYPLLKASASEGEELFGNTMESRLVDA